MAAGSSYRPCGKSAGSNFRSFASVLTQQLVAHLNCKIAACRYLSQWFELNLQLNQFTFDAVIEPFAQMYTFRHGQQPGMACISTACRGTSLSPPISDSNYRSKHKDWMTHQHAKATSEDVVQ